MSLRMNAGYIITDNIRVGDAEFVLGVNSQIEVYPMSRTILNFRG